MQIPETVSKNINPLYKDNTNRLWNEYDLLTYDEMINEIQAYERRLNPPILSEQDGGNLTVFPSTFKIQSTLLASEVKLHEGNIRYIRKSALIGVLSKVSVKQCLNNNKHRIYKDRLNTCWNEIDLISYEEAREIAETYLQSRLDLIQD